jgi:BirA family biotin operon repressor/biotin-[acetyl-CoA-carboxylase] ligase
MNEHSLKKTFSNLNIGGLRYFDSIGSTNDEALAWAENGARDLSLVVADEQTRGRGRLNRKWFTPAGNALALSLILRPAVSLRPNLSRIVGLAALALVESLGGFGLTPRIKWPNDILVGGKKMAGILIESAWSGENVDSVVIGMGVNVYKESVPSAALLQFPATSFEDALAKTPPAREELLYKIVSAFIRLHERIGTDEFIKDWEGLLAFRGEQVQIQAGSASPLIGELIGLEADGSLRLRDAHGKIIAVHFGDVSLRPSA